MKRVRAFAAERWGQLGPDARAILIYTLVYNLGMSVTSLFTNLYVLSLGYGKEFVGLLISIVSLPALFLSIPAGFLINRIGCKRSMVLGRALGIAALLILSLAESRGALIASRALSGISMVLVTVALSPLLTRCCEQEERPVLFSTQHAVRTLSGVVGSLIGGLLPGLAAALLTTHHESAGAYRASLLAGGAFMVISLAPLLLIKEPGLPYVRGTGPNLGTLIERLPTWSRVISPRVFIWIGARLFVPFLNVYFKEEVGVSNAVLGTIYSLTSLTTGLATLATPWITKKLGLVRAIISLRLLPIPLMVILAFSRWAPLVAITHVVRTTIARTTNPLGILFVMEQADDEERSLLNAYDQTGNRLASTLMPYLSGVIQVEYGFGPLFLLAGAAYLVSAGLMHAFFGRPTLQADGDTRG